MRNTKPDKQKERVVRQPKIVIQSKTMPERKTADETWEWLVRKGLLDQSALEARNYSTIDGCWAGEPCYIFGSGPPLKDVLDRVGWEKFRGRHTIGINHTIEEWDGFEWFFFLDRRFLEKTTYDITRFKGKIFAQATTGLKMGGNIVVFHCSPRPGTTLEEGLYDGNLSGLAALNLAIITGANPIYLLGFGMGAGGSADAYHYRPDYTAEVKDPKRFHKFQKVLSKFAIFSQYTHRIIHVTPGKDIPEFKKVGPDEFASKINAEKPRTGLKVVHLSLSDDPKVHSEITRHVLSECRGDHVLVDLNKGIIPSAGLYIVEHFLSTDRAVQSLTPAVKARAICIVHTQGCVPPPGFLRVVSLTAAWKKILEGKGVNSVLIRGGIDLAPYGVPAYEAKIFGRMTRWSPGKIHPEWNRICAEILDEMPESRCLFFVDKANEGGRPKLQHQRMVYSDECKINMDKAPFLQRLSVYVHANGSFRETMSLACVEAMAAGLPVVYLTEKTGVLEEVIGPGGVRCMDIGQTKDAIKTLLNDPAMCADIGKRGKEQARLWDKDRMIREFNALIGECKGV
jgi:glycosyltransferase involved in cell wall biosynthesis